MVGFYQTNYVVVVAGRKIEFLEEVK